MTIELKDGYENGISNCEIFWINLWKRTGDIIAQVTLQE